MARLLVGLQPGTFSAKNVNLNEKLFAMSEEQEANTGSEPLNREW